MTQSSTNVVYTCITNNYDKVPTYKPPGDFDYICFVDNLTYATQVVNICDESKIIYKICNFEIDPQSINRMYKIMPHIFLNNYEKSIYVDGNIELKINPFEVFDEIPNDKFIAFYLQPHRDCAYSELDELVRNGMAAGVDARKLKESFRVIGLPLNYGLFEANIIFRRHNNNSCILNMSIWWRLWQSANIKRDQPYLALLNFLTNSECIHPLGYSALLSDGNRYFKYGVRIHIKNKFRRLIRRIKSELYLYRLLR